MIHQGLVVVVHLLGRPVGGQKRRQQSMRGLGANLWANKPQALSHAVNYVSWLSYVK